MFSTDYPHWDFDDPQQVFKFNADRGPEGQGVPRQRQGVVRPHSQPLRLNHTNGMMAAITIRLSAKG